MIRLAGVFLVSCCTLAAFVGMTHAGPTITTYPSAPRGFDTPNFDRFDHSLIIERDLNLLRNRARNTRPSIHPRKPRKPRAPIVNRRPNGTIGTRPTRWPTRKPVVDRTPRPKRPDTHRRPRPKIIVRIPARPAYVPPKYTPPGYVPPVVVTYPKTPKPRGPVIAGVPPQPKSAPAPTTVAPAVASGRYRAREVLIALPSEARVEFINELSQTYGIEPRDSQGIGLLGVRIYRFSIRGARSVPQVVAEIQADQRVGDVQPNYIAELQGQAATGSAVQYALASLNVPDALTRATGRNITIAVIDTGVDMGHPELQGVVSGSYYAVRDAAPAAEPHGTAIAGIIGAHGSLSGVAPGARILAVRAFSTAQSGAGETDSLTLARAMDWAASRGAAVFNMSFAGPKDPLLERLLDAAHDKGIVLVAAAGNGGPGAEAVYPAAHPDVIAVTAVDHADRLYADANRGDYVAVAAPGVDILAPAPNGAYGVTSGTSMAAAHVSGIVALALETNPGLGTQAVRDLLLATALDLGPAGRDDEFGAGKANALDALMALSGPQTTRVAGDGVAGPTLPVSLRK